MPDFAKISSRRRSASSLYVRAMGEVWTEPRRLTGPIGLVLGSSRNYVAARPSVARPRGGLPRGDLPRVARLAGAAGHRLVRGIGHGGCADEPRLDGDLRDRLLLSLDGEQPRRHEHWRLSVVVEGQPERGAGDLGRWHVGTAGLAVGALRAQLDRGTRLGLQPVEGVLRGHRRVVRAAVGFAQPAVRGHDGTAAVDLNGGGPT